MYRWLDDNNEPVHAVSAEQHALDNPGHAVTVKATQDSDCMKLDMVCWSCPSEIIGGQFSPGWWDQQLMPEVTNVQT